MDLKVFLLERVIKWLIGGAAFDYIKTSVELINNEDMTGEEKRAKVVEDAKKLFGNLATFLINLAIEVAVTSLKAKLGELDGN